MTKVTTTRAQKAAKPVAVKARAKAPVEWPVETTAAPEPADVTRVAEEVSNPLAAEILPVPAASISKGSFVMTDAMETAKTYAEEAKTRFQSAFTEMNEKAKSAMEKSAKTFEEIGELTKGNLEAVVETSKIAAKGLESLGQEAAEFGRKSFEKTSATMKSFASVKSPAEFFQLQSELLTASIDSFASEAAKNSETVLKLVGDISQPISNRVSVVSEKFKSLAA